MKAKRITLCIIFWMFSIVSHAQSWTYMDARIWGSTSLDVVDNKLYLCGIDTVILGATSINKLISVYDGVSYDTSVGVSFQGQVKTVAKFNNQLYFGGSFRHIGNPIPNINFGIKNLARWDGTQFDSIGAFPATADKVNVLKVYNNELYIGGKFQNGAGLGFNNLMKYNGTNFSAVGGGIVGNFTEVWSLVEYDGDLIVAGSFYSAGGIPVDNIARWDGTQWHTMGDGIGPYIFCMTVDTIANILYAGGNVGWSGSTPIDYLARWDGQNWQQIGNGLQARGSPCLSVCMYKGELYAGTQSTPPNIIKKWNGQVWQTLNSAPSDHGVNKLCEFQGSLFASGNFNEIDSVCCYWGLAYYTDTTTVGMQSPNVTPENVFSIYPNPTQGNLQLTFTKPFNEKSEIEIYNAKGELIFQKSFEHINETLKIQLPTSIGSGVYVCKVVNKTIQQQRIFVLQ